MLAVVLRGWLGTSGYSSRDPGLYHECERARACPPLRSKMREIFYLRLCATLPVVIPVIAFQAIDLGFNPLDVISYLLFSLLFGGVPYVIFALGMLYWLRDSPPRTYWKAAAVAPILFIGVFAVTAIGFRVLVDLVENVIVLLRPADFLILFLVFPLYILPIGYFYVGLAYLGYGVLKKCRCLDRV